MQEFRDRAVWLAFDLLRDDFGVSSAAILSDTKLTLGVSQEESAEKRCLRKENTQLKHTNEILNLASAFFAK